MKFVLLAASTCMKFVLLAACVLFLTNQVAAQVVRLVFFSLTGSFESRLSRAACVFFLLSQVVLNRSICRSTRLAMCRDLMRLTALRKSSEEPLCID